MCSCGGGLTVWCFDCGDWVCEFCGCDDPAHLQARQETK